MGCKSEYDFTLSLTGIDDISDEVANAIYDAGCDDATLAIQHGRVYAEFSRMSESLVDAVLSAIADIRKAGIGADVLWVDECNLVTQAEIARRANRSRSAIAYYISGERGPGRFPAPVCNIAEGQPLWFWCEVASWLCDYNIIKRDHFDAAEEIEAINSALDIERFRGIKSKNVDGIRQLLSVSDPSVGETII